MTSMYTTDIHAANEQAPVKPGDAVWLYSMRNSDVPLAPGYLAMMGQLKEQFAALDQMQASKAAARTAPAQPQPKLSAGIPAAPRQLLDLAKRQHKQRLDAAIVSWANHYSHVAAV
ncbi:hypothetical protein RQP54_18275 [Curvibacter sp. APW13]|uniref:hypothetical protein n=1 Tax=Curvibacter sp. APW13 TaxID=3077236 RepID=UPI0028DD83C9|nr:hypothetical protein [Curvibacter sp. APW13]MDT8992826.1 hypothetical protein [Curvibacter sp. APW13]